MENKAFRLYGHGWTGNSIKDLNDLFSKGWTVKIVIPEKQTEDTTGYNTLILERKITIR